MHIQVVLTLPREAVSVPIARHTVSAALERAGIDRECLHEVQVALSEACTNVFQHAKEGDTYDVVISLDTERLTVDVLDSGAGFSGGTPPQGLPEDTSETGRGVTLMQAFTDHTSFDSVASGGGSVHLVKQLRWSEDAPLHRIRRALGHEDADPVDR